MHLDFGQLVSQAIGQQSKDANLGTKSLTWSGGPGQKTENSNCLSSAAVLLLGWVVKARPQEKGAS